MNTLSIPLFFRIPKVVFFFFAVHCASLCHKVQRATFSSAVYSEKHLDGPGALSQSAQKKSRTLL